MTREHRRSFVLGALGAAAFIVGAATLAAPAWSAPRVSGSPAALSVQVEDATLADVLDDFRAHFAFDYRSAAPLDRRLSGSYRGPLHHVLRRLLTGYDYVVKTSDGRVQVSVYGLAKGEEAPRIELAATRRGGPDREPDFPETTTEGLPAALGTPEAVTARMARAALTRKAR